MKISLVSDIHLEGSNYTIPFPESDVIVIAGDLSVENDLVEYFFERVVPSDKPVIYVPGNHEFEGKVFEEQLLKFRNLNKIFPNVFPLYNETKIIDDVKFIGTTLWSNFEGEGLQHKEEVKNWVKNIVDFQSIKFTNSNNQKQLITPEWMEKEHKKCYDFLSYELKNNPFDGTKFVVSHFAPHKKSIHPRFEKVLGTSYWVNHLEDLMGFSDFWAHGHTHESFSYEIEGTKVFCNPRGFSRTYNLSSNTNFNSEFIVNTNSLEPKLTKNNKLKK